MANGKVKIDIILDPKKFKVGMDSVKTSFGDFKKLGAGMAAVGVGVGAGLLGAAKAAGDFSQGMSNVSTLIDTSKESMSDMSDEVLKMSKDMPVALSDLTLSLYDVRSAGISADEAMSALKQSAVLSTAGLSSVSEATNIMTSALNAFATEGLSAAEVSNIVFKTVKAGKTTVSELAQSFGATAPIIQAAGVKLADFQAATAALTTVGIPASQAQNSLRAAIVSLQKPSKEMQAIFEALGVTTGQQLIKTSGSMGAAFKIVSDKAAEMDMQVIKASGSVEAAAAITSIAGATNKAYANTLDDMLSGTNAVSEAYGKQASEFNASVQVVKNQLQSVAIIIGQGIMPTIKDLLGIVSNLASWFNNLPTPIKRVITDLTLLTTAITLIGAPILILVGSLPALTAGFASVSIVVSGALTALAAVNPVLLAIVTTAGIVIANWGVIKNTAHDFVLGIDFLFDKLIHKIKTVAIDLKNGAIYIGKNLGLGILKGLSYAKAAISKGIKGWTTGIIVDIKKYFGIKSPSTVTAEIGMYLVEGLNKGIEDTEVVVPKLESKFKNAFDSIGGSFRQMTTGMSNDLSVINRNISAVSGSMESAKSKTSFTGGVSFPGVQAPQKFGGFFANGGIVPGNAGKPMPIVAHGGEMILNSKQQNALSNREINNTPVNPTFVYAPQIQTAVNKDEVFSILNQNQNDFFNMVQYGMETHSGLRSSKGR